MQSLNLKLKEDNKLKRIFSFLLLLMVIASVFAGCAEEEVIEIEYAEATTSIDYSKYKGVELSVYNWGYYISDGSDGSIDVNEEFERLTGIKIVYDNYDSNESLYAKLAGGGADYDIVIPSDYMVGRLIDEGMLVELNFDNIPNYKNIDDKYKNTEYDPENKYSVPYNVGMVGVIYNSKHVEGTPTSWSLLWDERYSGKILNFNNSRDAFAIAQFYNGIDINTTNNNDWDVAYKSLAEQKEVLQSYVMDEVFNKMESGEAAVAPYYAGDFFTMYSNNEDLAFYYPEEGTNLFIDAVCVLKNSKHKSEEEALLYKEAAELYINFLLDPAIGIANAEYMYYASPNKEVVKDEGYLEFLSELHPNAYEILYESAKDVKTQSFVNLPDETKAYMADKWTALGATITENSSNNSVYYICLVLIVVILALFASNKITKYRREKVDYE